MLGLDLKDLLARLPDAGAYQQRLEGGLHLLAAECGLDPEREVARLRACQTRLAAGGGPAAPREDLGMVAIAQSMTPALPMTFELVQSFARGQPQQLGYLTQGAAAADVPSSLRGLLKATLETYLEGRAENDLGEANRIVEGLGRAFPDMDGLTRYDRGAQALLVGFIPRRDDTEVKLYFNTRMLIDGAHRARVVSMAHGPGFDPADIGDAYDALYDANVEARFQHVGLDFDGSRRVKLYVRVDTARAFDHAARLAQRFDIDLNVDALRAAYTDDMLANEVEIALAFRPAAPPTLKWTYFFPGEGDAPGVMEATAALLDARGITSTAWRQCLDVLRVEKGTRRFPLHGVGLEFPERDRRKVNLYLSPGY